MGLFSSNKSSTVTQTFDERFVLDPTEGASAYGQSGDSSVISTPGSLAFGSGSNADNWQIAGMTFQNFDPSLIDAAYSALAENNKLLGDISTNFFAAQSEAQKQAESLLTKTGELGKDAASGQTYDITEIAAWAGVLYTVYVMVR